MACWRPATPGFIVTLIATILLIVVTFSVPYFKTIYFLRATVPSFNGALTFGTLGYCLEQSSGTTCSHPSIGYQLDINALLGNTTNIKLPNVIVKWLTYTLVLHIVALVLAAISALFGLLAHVREMSMVCFSTCVSGFAAAVTLLAFIFDIALFFLTKSRINSEAGGSATLGNALWLTLVAWLCLFFSSFFYCIGRCCVSNRPRGHSAQTVRDEEAVKATSGPDTLPHFPNRDEDSASLIPNNASGYYTDSDSSYPHNHEWQDSTPAPHRRSSEPSTAGGLHSTTYSTTDGPYSSPDYRPYLNSTTDKPPHFPGESPLAYPNAFAVYDSDTRPYDFPAPVPAHDFPAPALAPAHDFPPPALAHNFPAPAHDYVMPPPGYPGR